MRLTLALVLVVASLLACSGRQTTVFDSFPPSGSPVAAPTQLDIPVAFASRYAAAQTATTLFHVRFDQRNFSRIYAMTDDSFRATTKEADLTARLSALRDRVGMSQSENEAAVDMSERGSDLLVTLVMETAFENTRLTETFVWRVTPSETTFLVRYDTR